MYKFAAAGKQSNNVATATVQPKNVNNTYVLIAIWTCRFSVLVKKLAEQSYKHTLPYASRAPLTEA